MRKNLKVLGTIIVVIIAMIAFQINVFAYSGEAYSNVYYESGKIKFSGSYQDNASPSMIEYIDYYSESCYYGAILANVSMNDDTNTYNSFSSTYEHSNPEYGPYTKYTIGHTWYEPPITYTSTDYASDMYNYEESKYMYTDKENDFFSCLYQDIANAFKVDLGSYNKISTIMNEETNLAGIHKQLSLKYGDLYSIYLDSSNSTGIVLKQDLEGVYTLYRFDVNQDTKNGFKINSIDKVQGKYRFIDDYFIKNPNPPTINYEFEGSTIHITAKDNN